jgi:DNA (cytosine-5)-methyltransferase 1
MELSIGSLFSGIGGLELGLEMSGLGHTVWQVEQNRYCLSVLARHWPEAVRYEDVREVGSQNLTPVDVICGGFPCQDVSAAGKGAGLAGARSGLWYEFARVVGELRPEFVVIENVASGAKRWVDAVRGNLGELGYASLPIPLSASDCGAPHRRARIFIVARSASYTMCQRRSEGLRSEPSGDASEVPAALRQGGHVANSNGELLRFEPGRSGWADRASSKESYRDGWWATEPDVARMVHGLPGRVDRERALGNSVVPQCAEVIGHVIQLLTPFPLPCTLAECSDP